MTAFGTSDVKGTCNLQNMDVKTMCHNEALIVRIDTKIVSVPFYNGINRDFGGRIDSG